MQSLTRTSRIVIAVTIIATFTVGRTAARAATPPNIVLVLTDDQSRDTLPAMPWLSAHAGEWTNFTAAEDSTSLCCPSRSSILSGQYEWHTGVTNNVGGNGGQNLDESQTAAVWLSGAGYATGLFGKYLNGYPYVSYGRANCYVPPGWTDFRAGRGSINYWDNTVCENGVPVHHGSKTTHIDSQYQTNLTFSQASDFISREADAGHPFFAYIAPKASHEPWNPEDQYANASVPLADNPSLHSLGTNQPRWIRGRRPGMTATQVAERNDEERTLATVDDRLRDLMALLDAKGISSNTLVFFLTDNGWSWGHGYAGKWCELEDCSATPFLVHDPFSAPLSVDTPVANVDLAATWCELAGCTPGIAQDGASIAGLLDRTSSPDRPGVLLDRRAFDKTTRDFTGIREARWKYTEFRDGEHSMYDLSSDPYEMANLAGDAANADVQAQLAADLHDQEAIHGA